MMLEEEWLTIRAADHGRRPAIAATPGSESQTANFSLTVQ
jgi:hypothetical protein